MSGEQKFACRIVSLIADPIRLGPCLELASIFKLQNDFSGLQNWIRKAPLSRPCRQYPTPRAQVLQCVLCEHPLIPPDILPSQLDITIASYHVERAEFRTIRFCCFLSSENRQSISAFEKGKWVNKRPIIKQNSDGPASFEPGKLAMGKEDSKFTYHSTSSWSTLICTMILPRQKKSARINGEIIVNTLETKRAFDIGEQRNNCHENVGALSRYYWY